MRQIQIGNVTETVIERADYPPEKVKAVLADEVVAVLGYGVQGPGQGDRLFPWLAASAEAPKDRR